MVRSFLIPFFVLFPQCQVLAQDCDFNLPESAPSYVFTMNGDGTVTDSRTGLMWKRCAEGLSGPDCAAGSVIGYSWSQALALADNHSFAGYDDWRLPDIKELASIVENRCYKPSINADVFPATPEIGFWSSSPSAYGSISIGYSYAWAIHFEYGHSNSYARFASGPVRLVRGGQ